MCPRACKLVVFPSPADPWAHASHTRFGYFRRPPTRGLMRPTHVSGFRCHHTTELIRTSIVPEFAREHTSGRGVWIREIGLHNYARESLGNRPPVIQCPKPFGLDGNGR